MAGTTGVAITVASTDEAPPIQDEVPPIHKKKIKPSLENNCTINTQEYSIKGILSKGGQSIVYEAITSDGKEVCIKELYGYVADEFNVEKQEQEQKLKRELQAMQQLTGNPRFVEFIDAGYNTAGQFHRFCLVMAREQGKTLEVHLKEGRHYTSDEIKHFLRESLLGLADLHNLGLVHRDVAPQNIIIADNNLKFLDLGAVGDVFDESQSIGVGRLGYIAQEVLRSEAVPASDIYSLGKTMYRVMTRREIDFRGELTETDFAPLRTVYSDGLTDIIAKMCKPELSQRYATTYQVLDDLTVGHVTQPVVLVQDAALVAADVQRTTWRGYLSRLLTYPILGNAQPSTRRDFEAYLGKHNFNADDAAKVSVETNLIISPVVALYSFYILEKLSSDEVVAGCVAALIGGFGLVDFISRKNNKPDIEVGGMGIGNILSLFRPIRRGGLLTHGENSSELEEKVEEVVPDVKSVEGKRWDLGKINQNYSINEYVAIVRNGLIEVKKKYHDGTLIGSSSFKKPFPYQSWTYVDPHTGEKTIFQPEPHIVEMDHKPYLQFYNNSPKKDKCGPALMAEDGSFLGGRSDWKNIQLLFGEIIYSFKYAVLSDDKEDIVIQTSDPKRVVFSAHGRFKWYDIEDYLPKNEYMCFTKTEKINPKITKDIVVDKEGKQYYASPDDGQFTVTIEKDACKINRQCSVRKVTRYKGNVFFDEQLRTQDGRILVKNDQGDNRIVSFDKRLNTQGNGTLNAHYTSGKIDTSPLTSSVYL